MRMLRPLENPGGSYVHFIGAVLVGIVGYSRAYPFGAPSVACQDLTPGHGKAGASSRAYRLELTDNWGNGVDGYLTGKTYHVSIVTTENWPPFRGFALKATAKDDPGIFRGTFRGPLPGGTQEMAGCGNMNAVTHTDRQEMVRVDFRWTARKNDTKCIKFWATVVPSSDEWYKLSKEICPQPVSNSQSKCENGWSQHGGHCYLVGLQLSTWDEARWDCKTRGGTLTSIASDLEESFVSDTILQSESYNSAHAFWIGGHDRRTEANYMWVDGSKFRHFNWFSGWPKHNNYAAQPSDDGLGNEDCIAIRQSFPVPSGGLQSSNKLYWNDEHCQNRNRYVCRKEISAGYLGVVPAAPSCNRTLSGTSGTFSSQNFPRNYPLDVVCFITINAPEGHRIAIDFLSFKLEESDGCVADYVEVKSPGIPPVRHCGDWTRRVKLLRYITNQHVVTVKFVSDYAVTSSGFAARFSTERERSDCQEPGWLQYRTHCYRVIASPLVSWQTASATCQDLAARLTSVLDGTEGRFLVDLLMQREDFDPKILYWLGARRHPGREEWHWTDGSYFRFRDWIPGRNETTHNSQRAPREECLALQYGPGGNDGGQAGLEDRLYWNGLSCSSKARYVCKKAASAQTNQRLPHASNVIIRGLNGTIRSPNFPHFYPKNSNYSVTMAAPKGYRLALHFTSFCVEYQENCLYDYVIVQDGDDGPTTKNCGNYTSNLQDLQRVSLGDTLRITLISDHSNSCSGFEASFKTINVELCKNETHTSPNGTLESLSFWGSYFNNVDCTTTVTAPEGYRVFFEFTSFHLQYSRECRQDFLQMFLDGEDIAITLCGDRTRDLQRMKYITYGSLLRLRFHSDGYGSYPGYMASYTVVQEMSGAVELDARHAGTMQSPNFPNPYPSGLDYHYVIHAPKGHKVMLSFSTFDILKSKNCTQDHVVLVGVERGGEVVLCGEITDRGTLQYTSISRTLVVRFVAGNATNAGTGAGFIADYFSIPQNRTVVPNNAICPGALPGYYCTCQPTRTECIKIDDSVRDTTPIRSTGGGGGGGVYIADSFWAGICIIILMPLTVWVVVCVQKNRADCRRDPEKAAKRYNVGEDSEAADPIATTEASLAKKKLNRKCSDRRKHSPPKAKEKKTCRIFCCRPSGCCKPSGCCSCCCPRRELERDGSSIRKSVEDDDTTGEESEEDSLEKLKLRKISKDYLTVDRYFSDDQIRKYNGGRYDPAEDAMRNGLINIDYTPSYIPQRKDSRAMEEEEMRKIKVQLVDEEENKAGIAVQVTQL
ncbi:cubilin-like [Branchiostoma floridae x Branchiostoma japonicum]